MKISVITVCYNAVDTIEETIKSVIGQTYPDIEYIVIDGGSKDGTVDIIKKYADKIAYWVSEPDKGIYDAMNKGIAVATGVYINFMNAGDTFADPTVLQDLANYLDGDKIVYGNHIEAYNGGQIKRESKPLPLNKLKKQGILCHQSVLIPLKLHKVHPFDISYRALADFNFFFCAYNNWNVGFCYVDIAVSIVDMDSGMSKDNYDRNYTEFLKIVNPNNNPILSLKWNIRRFLGKFKRSFINGKH